MRVRINTTLKEDDLLIQEVDCLGIKKDNTIVYKNEGVNTKVYLKNNNVKIIRSCDDYEIVLDFSSEKGMYRLKREEHTIDLQLTSKEIIIEEGLVKIKYSLNTKDVCTELKLYYEVL